MNGEDHANDRTTSEGQTRLFGLQREIHHGLRVQHPECVEPDGDCPTCESYESRLAELLGRSSRRDRRIELPPRKDSVHRTRLQQQTGFMQPPTNKFSLKRGSSEQLFGGITKSHTRAFGGLESSSRLEAMKAIHCLNRLLPQEASDGSTIHITSKRWHLRRRDSLPLREAIPLWFAISSPLIGLIIGFLGAWFVTWLNS